MTNGLDRVDGYGVAAPRSIRRSTVGETVIDTSSPQSFEQSRDTITKLQQRFLDVLTEKPQTLEQILDATRRGRVHGSSRDDERGIADSDRSTARNVLGWLSTKGLSDLTDEGWVRV